MSCERVLNFDQWKTFSENYKPIRVWLLLVYKLAEKHCRLRLFSEFVQTQKRYPTSFDKLIILTWKLLVTSSQIFTCELKSRRTTLCKISHICCCYFKLLYTGLILFNRSDFQTIYWNTHFPFLLLLSFDQFCANLHISEDLRNFFLLSS